MDRREHIIVDSNGCHGQACINSTRVMVSIILDNLAANIPQDEILCSYPSLSQEALRAVIIRTQQNRLRSKAKGDNSAHAA